MTSPWSSSDAPAPGVLPDVLPARPPGGSGKARRAALTGIAALAAAAVAGTAWATASFLSGGGAQPADVLPADAMAVASVDFDPPAGQKLAAFRLSQRFPTLAERVTSQDGLKDQLLRDLFSDDEIDYDRDLRPWLGDRVAVAAVPDPGSTPAVVVAVAHTDREAAESSLRRLAAREDELAFAFSRHADYVLLGQTQAVVDRAAGADRVLADTSTWSDDVEVLDGPRVVTAWADLDAVWQSVPEADRDSAAAEGFEIAGRLVVGARLESDAVEVVGRGFGLRSGEAGAPRLGAEPGLRALQDLPSDSAVAAGVTGLGNAVVEAHGRSRAAGSPFATRLDEAATGSGLTLPEDLRTAFGGDAAAALVGPEDVAARFRTDDPERARLVVEQTWDALGDGLFDLLSLGGMSPLLFLPGYGFGLSEPFSDSGDVAYGDPGLDPTDPATPAPFGELGEDGPWAEDEVWTEDEVWAEDEVWTEDEGWTEDEFWDRPGTGDEHGDDPSSFGEPLTNGSPGPRLSEVPADLLRVVDDGWVLGSSAAAVDAVAAGGGGLGREPVFRKAVPDAEEAGFVLFVDVQRLLTVFGDSVDSVDTDGIDDIAGADVADLRAVEAVGFSAGGGEDRAFRLRVTMR